MATLHPSQRAALDHLTGYARGRKARALQSIAEVLEMSNVPTAAWEEAVSRIKTCAQVALHFHPDRPDARLRTVAESLLESGSYKSQFETQISNGSVSAFPGGRRHQWESRIFGGAYDVDGSTHAHRPKYGALDLMRHPDGPAPRFGSCFLLLKPSVSSRCSFTYRDSHQDPVEKGTFEELDDVLAALLVESFTRSCALGEPDLRPPRLVEHLRNTLPRPLEDPSTRPPARNLDHYIEAQVHGEVRIGEDVEQLVADPSFRGTQTGRLLEELCARASIPLHLHAGFALGVEEVPSDFRGPRMPSLAGLLARDGQVDARAIGEAVMTLRRDPGSWSARGTEAEVLQELKLLWHVLVRYGQPLGEFRSRRSAAP